MTLLNCSVKDTSDVVVEEFVVRGRHQLQEVLSVGFKPRCGGCQQTAPSNTNCVTRQLTLKPHYCTQDNIKSHLPSWQYLLESISQRLHKLRVWSTNECLLASELKITASLWWRETPETIFEAFLYYLVFYTTYTVPSWVCLTRAWYRLKSKEAIWIRFSRFRIGHHHNSIRSQLG